MYLYLLEIKEKEALLPDGGNSGGLGLLLSSCHLFLLLGNLFVGHLVLSGGQRGVSIREG